MTCRKLHGRLTAEMVEALIIAYWEAKMERSDVTRALYSSAVELDNEALIDAFARRMDAATKAMLLSAPNARYSDISLVNLTLLSVIFGTVRNVFERNLPPSDQDAIRDEMKRMCLAYLAVAGGEMQAPIQVV